MRSEFIVRVVTGFGNYNFSAS